ncbi:MobA-like NTP transferase domain-containing protein [Sphingomonas guangdongensis]|uniref:MobA-like NTP transferase domain-containing protein n=1 Tax=Sphingomonas guangdongensis TaxID=1141890 RepID=A0A285QZU9_9SPHN|nr:NTP transferase domain-containing protein [Sphingomonas guangdongensis]SOB87018.1 MobA-like NTP transferase domain-containing protein [Sphingomonas guangdongensis]
MAALAVVNPPVALVLAGSRGGVDPVAEHAGVTDKALAIVGDETMLARVVAALRGAGIERIAVAANDKLRSETERLGVEHLPAAGGPSASAAAALAIVGTPLLVTTADHALLRPAWVTEFIAAVPPHADVAVLLARREAVEAAAPGSVRTYLRFADGDWSGCNLFLLASERADAAVRLWQSVEADRKRPWRIVRRLGPGLLIRYLLGRLSLADAVAALGRRAGVTAAVVAARDGLAAVDVDKPADLQFVRARA